jgi:hypothetical protein
MISNIKTIEKDISKRERSLRKNISKSSENLHKKKGSLGVKVD